MTDKPQEPKQTTPKGLEIPVPTRGEFFANLDKVSKPTSAAERQARDAILVALNAIAGGQPSVFVAGGVLNPQETEQYAQEIIAELGVLVDVSSHPAGIDLRSRGKA